MTQTFRTAFGGRIDRAVPLRFTFDSRSYQGFAGDTLASALLANGVHLVGRSFKYHRPRGILSAGAEEPNALVTVSRGPGRVTPNSRATQVELYDGLETVSQNRFPSLTFDLGAAASLIAPLLPAGFYYKTFMGPRAGGSWAWRAVFEPAIRRAAGLGVAPTDPDPDCYAQYYDHCDVLVAGAGPAGLAAARAAGQAGARVILCDEQAEPGGSLLAEPDGSTLATILQDLRALPNVRIMPRTQCFGYYAGNFLGLAERAGGHPPKPGEARENLWRVRAREVVLATGAIERPLVFPGNDRPGVMLAGAARVYLHRFGAIVGRRVVVATAEDSAYRVALDLAAAGVEVVAIADTRDEPDAGSIESARAAGIPVIAAARVTGTRGRLRVTHACVARRAAAHGRWIACDAVLMSGGWTPTIHLFSQSRGTVVHDPAIDAFVPGTSAAPQRSAGGCQGTYALTEVLAEGAAAGADAAAGTNTAAVARRPARAVTRAGAVTQAGAGHPASRTAFVDFQNDVTAADIALAVREGMHSIEHIKRYTTAGMATDQGKTSNMNALNLAALALGQKVPETGLTTFRPPYTPVTFGTLAGAARGDLFDPVRHTPIHPWAAANGAVFEDAGTWKRAWYFPRPGETMHAAVQRECRQTRATAGLFDASTLGKIEVVGPDAAVFLDRMYVNKLTKLAPGRCRYGLLLNEQGFVMDDGIVARLAPDRFMLTTTTGGAASVLHHMEDYLQTEFSDLTVWLTSVTEQWAAIAVQGPSAPAIVAKLAGGFDLETLPHMGIRAGTVAGVAARIMRAGFTGERGFEVYVPAGHGAAVWEALWTEGREHDCTVYGTEAMHLMRAEKGYIVIGQDTDGTVTPRDLGLEGMIGKAKGDFVGKRSLTRPDMLDPDRPRLVGLLTGDPAEVLVEGAQIVAVDRPEIGTAALGHVTSAYFSPALGRSIALAATRGEMGQRLFATRAAAGSCAPVTVTAPVFLDPTGERLRG